MITFSAGNGLFISNQEEEIRKVKLKKVVEIDGENGEVESTNNTKDPSEESSDHYNNKKSLSATKKTNITKNAKIQNNTVGVKELFARQALKIIDEEINTLGKEERLERKRRLEIKWLCIKEHHAKIRWAKEWLENEVLPTVEEYGKFANQSERTG